MAFILDYQPHPGQRAIHESRGTRFRVACCGRRWGKTRLAAAELLDAGGTGPAGDYGWIAPTYLIAERGIDAIRSFGGGIVKISGRAPTIATYRGQKGQITITFLSADNPDSILGYGFHGIVLDEAARIPARVWQQNIRPTLSDKLGWGLFISTPFGRNWFFDLFTRGRGEEANCRSWSFPSKTNPYFPAEEFEEARRTLPQDIFRQEYEAEFLEDSAGVFRGIGACVEEGIQAPPAGGAVSIGLDLAKYTDWTVLVAMDAATGRAFAMERFNALSWPAQRERIVEFCSRWPNATLYMDATGIGDPIYDDLSTNPIMPKIEPIVLTNPTKTELIQRLAMMVETKLIGWPAEWTILTDELARYEYEMNGRVIRYSAPAGFHDDCVIALAMAAKGIRTPAERARMKPLPMPSFIAAPSALSVGREIGPAFRW